MNYGLLEPKVYDTDWHIAGITSIKFQDRNADWSKYLPTKERQSPPETMSCVTFSILNVVETQLNWLLDTGQIAFADAVPWLDSNDRFNLSDRYLAIKSGTTKSGNSLQKVLDTLRHYGCPPDKDLPFGGNSWEEYHGAHITDELDKKAKKLLEFIDIAYQWLWDRNDLKIKPILEMYLKQSPIQTAGTICQPWEGQEFVQSCPIRRYDHATMIFRLKDDKINDFDQYEPYIKVMDLDYPFLCGLQVVVSYKGGIHKVIKTDNGATIDTTASKGFWDWFKYYLTKAGVKFKEIAGGLIHSDN